MTNTLVIARRKGVKVRMFNTSTAKMGPWVTDPIAEAARADRVRLAERAAARTAQYHAQRERMRRLPNIHTRSTLEAYTVANIRTAAQNVLGLTFPSKMRKADMIAAYLAEQTARLA